MSSYAFKRRSFLCAIGASALGLRALLESMEAGAAGASSPPRLFVIHWPVGTVRPDFEPKGTGTTYTSSRLLKPFETASLRENMIVLYGLTNEMLGGPGGVGHQKGMVIMATGTATGHIRAGEFIAQDCSANGPSFDQIFLKRVKGLQTTRGYINAICDNRVDYNPETSTRCMSYSYDTRPVEALEGAGAVENIPLLPELSPLQLYLSVFGGLMPGGSTGSNPEQLLRAVKERKSVLDYSLRELARLRTLAPASESSKIDFHAEAVRKIETQLSSQIESGAVGMSGCSPDKPPDVVGGKYDGGVHRDYDNPTATTADGMVHEQVGKLHAGLIKAAFQCDLARVATLQWSPGVNHIAFQGFFPGQSSAIYMHHPVSHRVGGGDTLATTNRRPEVEYLANVAEWYNQRTATLLADWKTTTDSFGNSLLDTTVIPYLTEVSNCGHAYYPLPALIFGGQKLGLVGGQYRFLDKRPHNDMWLSVAQAFGLTVDDLKDETFMRDKGGHTGPIAGLLA
jgi:Protein of unknown function (DUF1552)